MSSNLAALWATAKMRGLDAGQDLGEYGNLRDAASVWTTKMSRAVASGLLSVVRGSSGPEDWIKFLERMTQRRSGVYARTDVQDAVRGLIGAIEATKYAALPVPLRLPEELGTTEPVDRETLKLYAMRRVINYAIRSSEHR